MVTFGLFPGEQLTKATAPRGYAGAVLRAGTLHESVFCSLSTWSLDGYVSHWKRTAERTLSHPQLSIFCSDLAEKGASLLVAFPDSENYRVEQWIVRRGDIVLDGPFISMRDVELAQISDASSWSVTRSEIEAYVRMGA